MSSRPYSPPLCRFAAALACAAVLACSARVPAEDWPQWRGLDRDGTSREDVRTDWPDGGPRRLWEAQVGRGQSPVSVANGRVVATGRAGKGDTVWCLAAPDGRQLWRHDYAALARLKGEPGRGAFDGPHAAPAICDGRAYALSRDGQVLCLRLSDGRLLWQRHLHREHEAELPECGFAGATLVVDGTVYVNVGARGTALDAATGKTKWFSGAAIAGYAAPTLADDGKGSPRLLVFGFDALHSVDPADGSAKWSLHWPTRWGANVADPMVVGASVLITAAYGRGAALVDLAEGRVRWRSKVVSSHCSPLVMRDGHAFGFDGFIDYPKNQALVCFDPLTGKERWRRRGLAGQLILAGDKLVMLLVSGELAVAAADAQAYRELGRARLLPKSRCSIPPTLADGKLYCRSSTGRLICLDVAAEKPR